MAVLFPAPVQKIRLQMRPGKEKAGYIAYNNYYEVAIHPQHHFVMSKVIFT